jgi:sugar/nucleoside kinase (ribokinase family)
MATYLGACVEVGPEDIDSDIIASHRVTYLEGYLWDAPRAKEAMLKAASLSHESGHQVALTLSDAFCVDRHRDSFRDLILNHVDILFANEDEIISLYQTENIFEAIIRASSHCELVAVTRGSEGSLVISGENIHQIEAVPVERVIDTTGAGDLYAAGFLFGVTHGYQVLECGRIGSMAAGEIITHFGARPEEELQALLHRSIEVGSS